MDGIHQSLKITICDDAGDAVKKGYNYSLDNSIRPIEVKEVVVVKHGTNRDLPTVDFILEDEKGNKFVFLITGSLLKSIPC